MTPSPEEPRIFQIGDIFRNLTVSGFLGAGNGGQVYAVDHPIADRRFALKVGHAASCVDPKQIMRKLAEAKAVYNLNHANIVRVVDIGIEPSGMVFQLMELLDGSPLGQLVARHGRLSPIYAIDIVLRVAWGLQAAHENGIIHRDVHPWNIFITRDGRVIVLDFSLAKILGVGIKTTAGRPGAGTAAYMGPDQIMGAPASPQFDVYALGLVFWQLLVGRHPFESELDSIGQMIAKQTRAEPESLVTAAGLPACCDVVSRAATAKNPLARYPGMWAFIQDLRALREKLLADPEAPLSVRSPPTWELEHAIRQNPEGLSEYLPPKSLPRPSPEPHIPSKRLVVAGGVPGRQVAATVPMAVFDAPPSVAAPPRQMEIAPPTVRRAAPPATWLRWWAVALIALAALAAGILMGTLWLLFAADGANAPTASAGAATSAPAGPRRMTAPPPKR